MIFLNTCFQIDNEGTILYAISNKSFMLSKENVELFKDTKGVKGIFVSGYMNGYLNALQYKEIV